MAELKNLPRELARLVKGVLREVVQLASTPWHLEAYCNVSHQPRRDDTAAGGREPRRFRGGIDERATEDHG